MSGEEEKPQRGYVRVPEECRLALETRAARYDVPLRSLTRLVLMLGMAMLEVDERSVKEAVMRMRRDEATRRTLPSQAAAATS